MADLASLGLEVKSSDVEAATKALGEFSASGKSAQVSADVLVASAVRLGITVEEVEKRLAAANDNLNDNAAMAIKLADATKIASAANDNFSQSMRVSNAETASSGRGFLATLETILNLTSHLKLLALAAYALVPAFRGFVNAGISKVILDIIPASELAQKAMAGMTAGGTALFAILARITPPILTAVVAFEMISAVWNKGSALLDKYANSLRGLYSDDVVQNLQKLTKNQGEAGDIISAAQIARATELGVRLQDATFIINQFLTKSIIDLTSASLKLQTVWVNFVEVVAKGAAFLSAIPLGKLAEVAARGVVGNAAVTGVKTASSLLSPDADAASLQSATDRLSALMGVANLAKESTDKLKASAGELGAELNIGGTFVARYSDAIKKLAEGGDKFNDTWDRVVKGIERQNAAMTANAATVGKDIEFQQQLRVETQLLTATKGGLNAATDKQIDKFVEYRSEMSTLDALTKSGINLNEEYAKTFIELSKASGEAKKELAQASFTIANDRAMESDKISLRSLTAYSAAQKGAVAEAQKRLELQDDLNKKIATQEQVDARAASARGLAMATEIKQLSEIVRARELSAKQTVDGAKLETEMFGKTIGQQEEMRANLQARQALEQEASQRRSKFDEVQYENLKKINKELGEQKQLNAIAAMNDNIKFGKNTSLLSPEDVAIAQQLKGIFPDVTEALNSTQAAAMRVNSAISNISSVMSNNMTSAIVDVMNSTKSAGEAFKSFGLVVVKALQEAIVKLMIVGPLMRGLQGGFGGLFGGLLGGGGIPGAEGPTSLGGLPLSSANGNGFYGGNVIPFANGGILNGPTMAPMALMGEAGPEAVVPLARGSDGKLGIASNGAAGGQQKVHVTVGVSVDNDGNLQAYVKEISQSEASRTVNATLDHPSFQQRVATASGKARSRNLR